MAMAETDFAAQPEGLSNSDTHWRESFTREELASLIELHDLRSWFTLALDWSIVFASMAMVAVWTNPLTIVLALFLIGARQLGFAVIMHEASHRTFLSNRKWNDWVGNWLAAYPVWSDTRPYRPYHLQHHAKTGTPDDPDLGLITPFPITRKSLWRKIWRDLSGQTGIKFAKGGFKRTFGRYRTSLDARRAANGVLVTNLVLFGILAAAGYPALYLLWVGAWLTTNTLVTRIRAIAEHALTPQEPLEPRGRTRTTLANPLARLFIAPNRVNYHLEHHLVMTVPHYSLPRFHRMLSDRGLLEGACIDTSYLTILKRASSKGEATPEPEDTAARKPVRYPPF
jgi:fatty acid desaturase